jgi:hypothetical protein
MVQQDSGGELVVSSGNMDSNKKVAKKGTRDLEVSGHLYCSTDLTQYSIILLFLIF